MSTFGEMQTQVLNDLLSDELTAEVQLAIKQAVKRLDENNAFWFQQERATTTLSSATAVYSLPTDYDSMDYILLTDGSAIWTPTFGSMEEVLASQFSGHTGESILYTIYDGQLFFAPSVDDNLTIRLGYQRNIGEPTATSAYTSTWFTTGYDAVRFEAEADLYLNVKHDAEKGQIAKGQAKEAVANLMNRNERRLATGVLRTKL